MKVMRLIRGEMSDELRIPRERRSRLPRRANSGLIWKLAVLLLRQPTMLVIHRLGGCNIARRVSACVRRKPGFALGCHCTLRKREKDKEARTLEHAPASIRGGNCGRRDLIARSVNAKRKILICLLLPPAPFLSSACLSVVRVSPSGRNARSPRSESLTNCTAGATAID